MTQRLEVSAMRTVGAILLASAVSACAGESPQSADLVIERVSVVDVMDGVVREDQTLFVEGGRLTAILPSTRSSIPDGSEVVDASGHFVVPGLWDAHVHTAADGRSWDFPILVAHGITSVRNMHADGDALGEAREIKRALAAGEYVGPRYLANGSLVDGFPPVHQGSVVVTTGAEARATVDSLVDGGADFIKVYDNLTPESYRAIIDQARIRGIPVDGHMPFAVAPAEAASSRQRTVEHLTGMTLGCSSEIDAIRADYAAHLERVPEMNPIEDLMGWMDLMRRAVESRDETACAEVVAAYATNGVAVVPTLVYGLVSADPEAVLADPQARRLVRPGTWEQWTQMAGSGAGEAMASLFVPLSAAGQEDVRALHAAGAPILAGTDIGNPFLVTGRSLHDELAALVSAGLSPLEALRSATVVPARVFGMADSLGTVETGAVADLVLLAGNPLEDIENVRSVTGVVLRGEYLDQARLDALVEEAISSNDPRN